MTKDDPHGAAKALILFKDKYLILLRNSKDDIAPSQWDLPGGGIERGETIEETLKVVNQMTLEGVADKITCPLLVIHGENDRQVPLWHAERTIEAAVNSPQRELKICRLADGAAEHCGADNGTGMRDYIADWCAEAFAAQK